MAKPFGARLCDSITFVMVLCVVACTRDQTKPHDTTAARAQSGGAVSFASAGMIANLCPLTASADSARGLNDSTINFIRANGIFHYCIPEYHDDQRLYDGVAKSADYGPVAHTFAFPEIALQTDHTQFDAEYLKVAIVDIDEILEQMPEPYTELGLKTRHSCLYLKHHHRLLVKNWLTWFTALMVTPTSGTCPASPAETNGKLLDVTIEKYSDRQDHYPPVTRFVEGASGRTGIGVRCTNRWCVVKPRGFGTVPNSAHHDVSALTKHARGNVKGWFDDQILGIPDADPKYKIHRKVRASIIPDTLLGSYHVADYLGGYKIVATVYLPSEPPKDSKYDTLFNFSKGTNIVGLRATIVPKPGGPPGALDTLWYAQVTNARLEVKSDIWTHRMDHSKWLTSVPATARWRWNDADEDFWIECDIGCCLVNGRA